MVPATRIDVPDRWAASSKVTRRVVPRRVRSPVAAALTSSPSAGREPTSMGDVRVNVDVGWDAVASTTAATAAPAASLVNGVLSGRSPRW